MNRWQPIDTAPRDGTPIRIRGFRFTPGDPQSRRYYATAIWATRCCPRHIISGWFPAADAHDGAGDFNDVTDWKPL